MGFCGGGSGMTWKGSEAPRWGAALGTAFSARRCWRADGDGLPGGAGGASGTGAATAAGATGAGGATGGAAAGAGVAGAAGVGAGAAAPGLARGLGLGGRAAKHEEDGRDAGGDHDGAANPDQPADRTPIRGRDDPRRDRRTPGRAVIARVAARLANPTQLGGRLARGREARRRLARARLREPGVEPGRDRAHLGRDGQRPAADLEHQRRPPSRPRTGAVPTRHSNAITPIAQMSAWKSTDFAPSTCSGLM